MAHQISQNSLADNRQPALREQSGGIPAHVRRTAMLIVAALVLSALPGLRAATVASKNNEGNRLFNQGKYEEAEKAYLEAQVKSPGKPEVLYNLGNSLIKQKKYNQGIQSLWQSRGKGNKGIKENSWYNAGNALYSMGAFKDSAESYIQALKLNPADKDAKHNLELALIKLKQQKQKDSSKQDKSQAGKEDPQQSNKENQNSANSQREQKEPANSQEPKATRREGSISKEQALQILDALQSRELEEQRKLMERRARLRTDERDW